MVRLATRHIYIHVVIALTKSIATRPPSLFREHNHGHLAPGSIKELLHKGWGSPRPPHKDVIAAPHPAGESKTLPASHQDSKNGRHTEYKLEQLSSTAHKAQNLALTLKLELA